MKIKNRIQAFTLSELLIVLLLTAIVVGLAFSILTLVQRQMSSMHNTLEDGTRFRQLQQQLTIDMNTFHDIKFIAKDSSLVLSHPLDSVMYTFNNTSLIREKDTFKINLNSYSLFYKGLNTAEGKVDAIKLNTLIKGYQREIFLYKLQDAETLLR